jgi:pre-mRNA-processing factor 19
VKQSIGSLHKSDPSGVNSVVLSRQNPSQFLTAGNDKIVQIYDSTTSKIVASLSGHTKKVHRAVFREDEASTLVVSASADKTSRVWSLDSASGQYAPKHTFKVHKGEVTGLSIHPTKGLLGLCSADKTYSINDLSTFKTLYHASSVGESYRSSLFHPDGLLYALGTTSGVIQIFDIRSGSLAASLGSSDSPYTINSLSFSENGYHLLAPGAPSVVNIWDLRHISVAHSINLGDDFKVNAVKYDLAAGSFLGIAGNQGLRVYQHKSWELLQNNGGSGVEITDIDWKADGSEIWAVGGRELQVFGTQNE